MLFLKVLLTFLAVVYIVITIGLANMWFQDYDHIKRDYELGIVKCSGSYALSIDWSVPPPEPKPEDYYTQEDVKAAARSVLLAPLWPLFLLQGFVEEARKFIIDVQGGNE